MSNSALETSNSAIIDAKFTAAQIEAECPLRLQQIGKEIQERLEKARKQHQQAENHLIAVNERIAEAKRLCDDGGFKKFRELFCPQLGKSQAYVLHAIGSGKQTLEQHRTEQRDRKRKSRAKQKPSSRNSGTVTENSSREASVATLEDVAPASSRSAVARGNPTLFNFSSHIMELVRITSRRRADDFVETSVSTDALTKLGKLLTKLVDLKKSAAATPAPAVGLPDNCVGSGIASHMQPRTGSSV